MDDFEKSLNHILVDTFYSILKFEEKSLKKIIDTSVTITEAHMIEAIGNKDNEETTASEIASLLNITMPTTTIAIKKLESKGLVKKVPCNQDGRRIIISLTETGKKIERAHRLFHTIMIKDIIKQLQNEEKEVLYKALHKLSEFFKDKIST